MIAGCKQSLTVFMAFMFCLSPLTYFIRVIGWIDDDVWAVSSFSLSLITKFLFIYVLSECQS
jgi:uncharacterized membrane protein YkvA (DUF1232 family)